LKPELKFLIGGFRNTLAACAAKRNALAYRPKLQENFVLARIRPRRLPELAMTGYRESKVQKSKNQRKPQRPIRSPIFVNEPQKRERSILSPVRPMKAN
jgi:hypothetical protein